MSRSRGKAIQITITALLLSIVTGVGLKEVGSQQTPEPTDKCNNLTLLAPTEQTLDPQPRTALVIGNDNYPGEGKLDQAIQGAKAMAQGLRGVGFEVIDVKDGSEDKIKNALTCFRQKLNQGGAGVFYYAGHAVQVKEENYLVPVDAKIEGQEDVGLEAISLKDVLTKIEAAENNLNIVILDSCNNNPYVETQGLATIGDRNNFLIAYATEPGRTVNDDALFTAHILQDMKEEDLDAVIMFRQIQQKISRATGGEQKPTLTNTNLPIWAFNPGSPANLPVLVADKAANPDDLYERLESFLAAEELKKANDQTWELMKQIGVQDGDYRRLSLKEIQNFSCPKLKDIDYLWLSHSTKFGFTRQKEIYESLGGTYDKPDPELYVQFAQKVGWKQEHIFNKEAPEGHLPLGFETREHYQQIPDRPDIFQAALFSRVRSCR